MWEHSTDVPKDVPTDLQSSLKERTELFVAEVGHQGADDHVRRAGGGGAALPALPSITAIPP